MQQRRVLATCDGWAIWYQRQVSEYCPGLRTDSCAADMIALSGYLTEQLFTCQMA